MKQTIVINLNGHIRKIREPDISLITAVLLDSIISVSLLLIYWKSRYDFLKLQLYLFIYSSINEKVIKQYIVLDVEKSHIHFNVVLKRIAAVQDHFFAILTIKIKNFTGYSKFQQDRYKWEWISPPSFPNMYYFIMFFWLSDGNSKYLIIFHFIFILCSKLEIKKFLHLCRNQSL